jgi:hypothetical protein
MGASPWAIRSYAPYEPYARFVRTREYVAAPTRPAVSKPALADKTWITRDENSNDPVGKLSDPRNRKILIHLALAIPPLGTIVFSSN